VWLALKQVGRSGYVQMISDDIRLARELYHLVDEHPNLEALTQNLSITTFRFVPEGLTGDAAEVESYLNELNVEILTRLQEEGEVFLSNAVIHGKYALRVCVVNFRTSLKDIEALIEVVNRVGREVDERLRPKYFMS
jgi:glutamate/tyrosine decarboxylase-like PLP-dependent enzyme